MKQPSIRKLLSQSFAGNKMDIATGKRVKNIVGGKSMVDGHYFLAPFEIDKLEKAIRERVQNL